MATYIGHHLAAGRNPALQPAQPASTALSRPSDCSTPRSPPPPPLHKWQPSPPSSSLPPGPLQPLAPPPAAAGIPAGASWCAPLLTPRPRSHRPAAPRHQLPRTPVPSGSSRPRSPPPPLRQHLRWCQSVSLGNSSSLVSGVPPLPCSNSSTTPTHPFPCSVTPTCHLKTSIPPWHPCYLCRDHGLLRPCP